MLVKILSGKTFFSQFVLAVCFLALFCWVNFPLKADLESVLGLFFFFISCGVALLFFNNSNLVNYPNIANYFYFGWILVFSGIAEDYKLSISLLAVILIFWRLIQAESGPDTKKYLFDVGLLLSISSFFYPPSIFLLGFLLFIFVYKQTINLRGFILFLIGLSLPMIVGTQVLYLVDSSDWWLDYQVAFYMNFWSMPVWWLIPFGILILICWLDHFSHIGTQDINKKYYYFLTFLYFVNWIVILILFGGDQIDLLAFLGLPLTIFLIRYTQYQNKKAKEIFLWMFSIFILVFYFREEIRIIYDDLLGNVSF